MSQITSERQFQWKKTVGVLPTLVSLKARLDKNVSRFISKTISIHLGRKNGIFCRIFYLCCTERISIGLVNETFERFPVYKLRYQGSAAHKVDLLTQ
jgi:hypothetical protein